jgi:hypothetical protein
VIVAGPAGVGKTRLARECLRMAEGAGFPVASTLLPPGERLSKVLAAYLAASETVSV